MIGSSFGTPRLVLCRSVFVAERTMSPADTFSNPLMLVQLTFIGSVLIIINDAISI